MAKIFFYEKPGCGNNRKQKELLQFCGHEVVALDLLSEKWTAATLRPFFGNRPVIEWFNPASPRIKSAEIDPARLDEERALQLMLTDSLLIRRPLIAADGRRAAGFDRQLLHDWLGLPVDARDLQSCRKSPSSAPCPEPGG